MSEDIRKTARNLIKEIQIKRRTPLSAREKKVVKYLKYEVESCLGISKMMKDEENDIRTASKYADFAVIYYTILQIMLNDGVLKMHNELNDMVRKGFEDE